MNMEFEMCIYQSFDPETCKVCQRLKLRENEYIMAETDHIALKRGDETP